MAYAGNVDPRLQAVQDYLLSGDDYPELFDDKPYRMKVQQVEYGDLDADGLDEVILLMKPHYRQSPTIVIFRVDRQLKVTRVIEGLAPGPLVALSGEHLDSHTLGAGVDVQISGTDSKQEKNPSLVMAMLKNMGAVVEYKNFYHMDSRSGRGVYIDMTHLSQPPVKDNCDNFEFSPLKAIRVMSRKDGSGNYLLAHTGSEIYAYKIHRFLDNGLMDKTLEVLPAH
ncbi:MAG: hypothetical protein HUJ30_03010 [Gammaproteobacteria bacterium]|nr:hypothetical protein [Gammaproteobacteria bacterium]